MDGIVVGKVDIFIIVFGNFVGVVVNVVVIFIVVFEVMGKELFCLYDLYSIKIWSYLNYVRLIVENLLVGSSIFGNGLNFGCKVFDVI